MKPPPPSLRIAVLCADRGIQPEAVGGASVHLRGMLAGFESQGAEVCLWSSRRAPARGTLVERLPNVLRGSEQDELGAFLAAFKPDLVYERLGPAGPVGEAVARSVGASWALEVNAPLAWEDAMFRGRRAHRRSLTRERRHLASADKVIVVSESLARYVVSSGLLPERVLCIPNGYDSRSAQLLANPKRREFNLSRPMTLGYAGTFKPWQGMLESLPALQDLAGMLSPGPLVLDLWGDGPLRQEFVSQASALAPALCVHWRGWGLSSEVAAARQDWDAAWVPLAAWPPPVAVGGRRRRSLRSVERAFGEPIPECWFCPLKEVEARAMGLPVWRGQGLPEHASGGTTPQSWSRVASLVLEGLGFTSRDASWEDAAVPGAPGPGEGKQSSDRALPIETHGQRAVST